METETKGLHSFVSLFRRRSSRSRSRPPPPEPNVVVVEEKKKTKHILGIPISTPRKASSRSTSPPPRASRHQGGLDALPVNNMSFPPSQSSSKIHSPQPHVVLVPAIVQTPPSPNRPGSSPPRLGHSRHKENIDSGHWYQPMTIDTVAEERLSKGEVVPGDVHRVSHSTERVAPTTLPKLSQTTKQRRHGSFDFERVGLSSNGVCVRSPHPSIATSAGLAGIGTNIVHPQRNDTKLASPTSAHSSAQNLVSGAATIPDYTSASSTQSHEHSQSTHHSASTNGGHKSSWGRSAGKKASGNQNRTKKRRIPSHLTFLGTSHHPAFEFEPAVPSPTGSNGATIHTKPSREKAVDSRQSTPDSSTKGSVGFRSGHKGRSLDLNLGLSWAPTKVREEALLPSPFGKNLSASSRSSTAKKPRNVDEMGVSKTTDSKAGRDVAELFRQVLDDASYASFKKYVHRFDAHDIPFDGPNGIVRRVERLLERSPRLSPQSRQELVESFVRVVLQNA